MKVLVTDRTGSTPRRVQAYARRKLEQLGRHFDVLTEGEVEFATDSRRSQTPIHVVDLTVRGVASDLPAVRAHGSGHDLIAVVDSTLDLLDRDVRKLKEEVTSHP
ncbi:MAG TPA: ribosome-associated translation inhibitor RaiA [Candidatus Acidoferrales bacterium]|nr:ribosome-associated translation inhibitor RaiA [Candidatus Acidoferrales bacterium]